MKKTLALLLLVQILLVKSIGSFPNFIEKWYSTYWYTKVSHISRFILGKIPFSVGDIMYLILVFLLLKWIWSNRKGFLKNWKTNGLTFLSWFSVFYFLFHVLWGMNYYRVPLDQKLQIEKEYSQEELIAFTEKIIAKTNALHLKITQNDTASVNIPYSTEEIFILAQQGYQKLPAELKEFQYHTESIKPSLLRVALSYMGFGGYLNPFTGEAQLNTLKPKFTLPMTTCHEMGHQMGIASESECNFIGFLAASRNDDLYFQYSAMSFTTRFCLGNLEKMEEGLSESFLEKINPGILKDFDKNEAFWDSYHSPIDTFFEFFYDSFLKANQQEGMVSYSRFIGLAIGYENREK